jgi:hypothetical protein
MKCTFQVGQKVVCVLPYWWNLLTNEPAVGGPKEAEIVTIIGLFGAVFNDEQLVMLRLREHIEQFDSRGFRPLQDRPKEADTDISVFYPLLKVKEPEAV